MGAFRLLHYYFGDLNFLPTGVYVVVIIKTLITVKRQKVSFLMEINNTIKIVHPFLHNKQSYLCPLYLLKTVFQANLSENTLLGSRDASRILNGPLRWFELGSIHFAQSIQERSNVDVTVYFL